VVEAAAAAVATEPEVVAEVAEPAVEAVAAEPEPEVEVEAAPAMEPVLVAARSSVQSDKEEQERPKEWEMRERGGAAVIDAVAVRREVTTIAPERPRAAAAAVGDPLQSTLWAAASMVASSASVKAAVTYLPPQESTARLAKPELVLPTATPLKAAMPEMAAPQVGPQIVPQAPPQGAPTTAPNSDPNLPPGLMAAVRRQPDSMTWFVFGGTAAFLGVIWVAIWLVAGK
jgi:hypothetical protein